MLVRGWSFVSAFVHQRRTLKFRRTDANRPEPIRPIKMDSQPIFLICLCLDFQDSGVFTYVRRYQELGIWKREQI